MASRIAKLIKGQDIQAKQLASIQRGCVRTVHTNALRVEKEVTAKQIVKRGPSLPLAKASGDVDKETLEAPALLLLRMFP